LENLPSLEIKFANPRKSDRKIRGMTARNSHARFSNGILARRPDITDKT
jgi:hypothetical protein